MSDEITFTSVGVHEGALTRGRRYRLLACDTEKRQVRVHGDNGRTRWFPVECFDLDGGPAPVLVRWQFDEAVATSMPTMWMPVPTWTTAHGAGACS